MSPPSIQIEPMAAALGAEIHGVDLTQPLDDETFAEVERVWLEHQVIVFRDQPLGPEAHKAFASRFGPLHVHPVIPSRKDEGHPEIVVLESDERRPFLADAWHSDVTFEDRPPLGSVLHAVAVPETGGDTLWASMYAAYEALSDRMQRLLSELRAVHDGGAFRAVASPEQREELEKNERAVHPVVRTHPVTGRKGIFVNSAFTRRIEGMKPAESQALLGFLYQHLASPDWTVRLRWRDHTVAFWDNRCTQHRVVADNRKAHRRMERVTIIGDVPV